MKRGLFTNPVKAVVMGGQQKRTFGEELLHQIRSQQVDDREDPRDEHGQTVTKLTYAD